jgi:hypothetical protein
MFAAEVLRGPVRLAGVRESRRGAYAHDALSIEPRPRAKEGALTCRDPRGLADDRMSGPAESGTVTLGAPQQVADGEVGKHGSPKGRDHSPGVCTLAPRQGEEDSALATRGAAFRRHAHGGPQGNEDDEARDPWAECAHVRKVAGPFPTVSAVAESQRPDVPRTVYARTCSRLPRILRVAEPNVGTLVG